MPSHEEPRSDQIIRRLQNCKRYLLWACKVTFVIMFSAPGAWLGSLAGGPGKSAAAGALIGLVASSAVGVYIGMIVGIFLECVIDWMCQLLAVQKASQSAVEEHELLGH